MKMEASGAAAAPDGNNGAANEGLSPPASTPTLEAEVAEDRETTSLKGITSTNDDPTLCAICSKPFPEGCYTRISLLFTCCGKRICTSCHPYELTYEGNRLLCSLCKRPASDGDKIGVLKKHAKRGRPWAQYYLAIRFRDGQYVTKSPYEAMRWLRKAAGQDHPGAYLLLAEYYCAGEGCSVDLSKARECAEKAKLLDDKLTYVAEGVLLTIANATERSNSEAKISILVPLAKRGMPEAQFNLGLCYARLKDYDSAEGWFVAAALQGDADAAYFAMDSCRVLKKYSQAKFWFHVSSKRLKEFETDNLVYRIDEISEFGIELRSLRDTCGGCGAALDGKMRKMCKQCKTYCYCGRECQKLHWNRQGKHGHREDCTRTAKLKERMGRPCNGRSAWY